MTRKAPNYIWRKWVAAAWLERNETALNDLTGGMHALIERPGRARIGLEFFCASLSVARALAATFGGAVTKLPADWEARSFAAQQTKPLRIGRRLEINDGTNVGGALVPRRSRLQGPSHILVIPAGAAFGTGEHATTAMSLRLLERESRGLPSGWRMLDAGTGSGILALAARRFGAGEVVAVDNDPRAIRTARENARANHLREVKFITGDIHQHTGGTFDIITANLYSELLTALLPRFRRGLRKDGRLILSGVLRLQEAPLQRALKACGFRVAAARRRGKWVALLALCS